MPFASPWKNILKKALSLSFSLSSFNPAKTSKPCRAKNLKLIVLKRECHDNQ